MRRLVLLFVLFAFVSAWSAIVIVENGETVQEAIDRADEGDTVIVPAGVYSGNVVIDKNLILQGNAGAIIEPPVDFGSANSVIIVRGDNSIDPITVTIQNLTIQNRVTNPIKYGVFFWENLTAYFYNNTVTGFNIESDINYGMGLICYDSNGGAITGNTFSNNTGCINISTCTDMLIDNNILSEFSKWGISTGLSTNCNINANEISSTQAYLLYGILIGNSSDGLVVNNNTISLPTYSYLQEGTNPDSLYFVRPYGIAVSTGGAFSNTISNNIIDGCARSIENESNQYGLTTISGNTFGATVSPSFAAVFFDGGNADITENTFADTVRSIEFVNTGNINIHGNNFTGMSYFGLAAINLQHDCFGLVTINENAFNGGRGLNIWNQSAMLTNGQLDATYNWWGDNYPIDNILDLTAPAAPDTTWTPANPVDYTPWYLDATMEELVWSTDTTISSELATGWNLWSYNVLIADHSVEAVFAPIMGNVVKIKSILESYDPALNPMFNTLHEIVDGHGYWIKVSSAITFELTGAPMTLDTDVALDGGWNLVAFIPQEAYEVDYTFASLINAGQLLKVKSILESFDPALNPMFNTLHNLYPANGYWVKVTQNLIFNYPEAARSIPEYVAHNYIWEPVIYTNSTCAYARTDLTEGQIGAFVNGECRAVTEIKEGYVSLVINGEEAETVNFKLYQKGEVIDLNTKITTDPGNDVFFEFKGSGYVPVSMNLREAYPNPFNPVTTLSFEVPQETALDLSVYNIKGQKVATLANGTYQPGVHNVVWNAESQASGVYFLRLVTNEDSATQKVILMK
jgi:nitrous oxidase accessory protein NosD